jgi:hypothetical protein
MISLGSKRFGLLAALLLSARAAFPCTVVGGLPSPSELVRAADAVVRAAAVGYDGAADEKYGQNLVPQTRIRFKVHETIRGTGIDDEIVLPGFLVDKDDFNDDPVPRTFVRYQGRGGNCYADTYRRGGEFLLFLRRTITGAYSVRWSPLAPLNEQLHGEDDPWLVWVRADAQR